MKINYIRILATIAMLQLMTYTSADAQLTNMANDVFSKCYLENTPKGFILKAELEQLDGDHVLYFDKQGNIKKYVMDFELS